MKTIPLRNKFAGPPWHGMIALAILWLSLFAGHDTKAFALLGRYTSWMTKTNNYYQPGDIGGPMNLGEEYRWDVPVMTYAFDKSFVDYFGSNGVAAVESAIQILNDLPAASDIVLSNYPPNTRLLNIRAASQGVYDLKSTALALLIEQLGLTQPARNILDLHGWDPALLQSSICGDSACANLTDFPNLVIQRNFDPATFEPSFAVNGTIYACTFGINTNLLSNYLFNYIYEFPRDPMQSVYTAVAEAFSAQYSGLQPGNFYTGLTSDDAGGLNYLLNATNVNWESLPKNVIFTGPDHQKNKRLRGTWRPGVEKIAFVPQPQNSHGKFKTVILKFTAFYVAGGMVLAQPAERIVSHPDILFSAAETYPLDSTSPMFLRTGTIRWANNARQNGNPGGAGPGVINPPIKITFDTFGERVVTGWHFNPPEAVAGGWASFDASTNPPVLYPLNTGQKDLFVRLHFFDTNSSPPLQIKSTLIRAAVPYGDQADLQISTNKGNWVSLITVTNTGAIIRWDYLGAKNATSFRVIPAGQ